MTTLVDYLLWFPRKLTETLSFFIVSWTREHTISSILILLSIPAAIYFIRRKSREALILFSPLAIALALAVAWLLPFDNRVAIYAVWPLLISGMAGLQAFAGWFPRLAIPAVLYALALLISLPMLIYVYAVSNEPPPHRSQSSQPVLRELKKQMQPGDVLYVYYRGRHAVNFYGPKEGITNYLVGRDYKTAEGYLRELDSLRGNKRVWFFYSQWVPPKPFPDTMKAYLGGVIGKEIARIKDPNIENPDVDKEGVAEAILYDLSAKDEK